LADIVSKMARWSVGCHAAAKKTKRKNS